MYETWFIMCCVHVFQQQSLKINTVAKIFQETCGFGNCIVVLLFHFLVCFHRATQMEFDFFWRSEALWKQVVSLFIDLS